MTHILNKLSVFVQLSTQIQTHSNCFVKTLAWIRQISQIGLHVNSWKNFPRSKIFYISVTGATCDKFHVWLMVMIWVIVRGWVNTNVSMQVLNQLEERASLAETRRKEEEVRSTILEFQRKQHNSRLTKRGKYQNFVYIVVFFKENVLFSKEDKVTTRWEGPQSLSYRKYSLSKDGLLCTDSCVIAFVKTNRHIWPEQK